MQKNGFQIIPEEEFDLKESQKHIFSRFIVPYNVVTYRSLEYPHIGVKATIDFYYKIVPCNPILDFFSLARRFDKNRKELEPETEIRYADEVAREFCGKYSDIVKQVHPPCEISVEYTAVV